MPYKHNKARRHKIPRSKYRVTHWHDYDAALQRRGSLTVWFTEEARAAWIADPTGKRGAQPVYSEVAIETALTIRLVFKQPLRQTEGLLKSLTDLLKLGDFPVPDHTTLSRRGRKLKTLLPVRRPADEALHLVVDSTGLKIYGEGEWLPEKHGGRSRRRWRKLPIALDAETRQLVATELTTDEAGDSPRFPICSTGAKAKSGRSPPMARMMATAFIKLSPATSQI